MILGTRTPRSHTFQRNHDHMPDGWGQGYSWGPDLSLDSYQAPAQFLATRFLLSDTWFTGLDRGFTEGFHQGWTGVSRKGFTRVGQGVSRKGFTRVGQGVSRKGFTEGFHQGVSRRVSQGVSRPSARDGKSAKQTGRRHIVLRFRPCWTNIDRVLMKSGSAQAIN